jgi:uncharacterized membrane protein
MSTLYNTIAGRNQERLGALSDGVFAIAMTLLVLDLHVPIAAAIHSEGALWSSLLKLAPSFVAYFMSFITLGIFWVGQQTQLDQFGRTDRNLAWIHLGFLLIVSLIPFSTALLAAFITYRLALLIYWLNIFLLGVFLFIARRYGEHATLMKEDATPQARTAADRRIIIAQSLYAVGALLCIVSTRLSIAAIVLVQLNYVFAPRIRLLYRL